MVTIVDGAVVKKEILKFPEVSFLAPKSRNLK